MDSRPLTILAIDDDQANLELICAALSGVDATVQTADEPCAGLERAIRIRPLIVLLDLMMPTMSGMEVLEQIRAVDPSINVILMTAHYSTESAVEAIKKGACDYLNKPIALDKLRERVQRLIEEHRAEQRKLQLERELVRSSQFESMIGHSSAIEEVFAKIRRVAPHYRTVLVNGPTGSGKELVAGALHRLSPVGNSGRFVVCNCSALVETLFESELFGYVKGAFTGAAQDKIGLFEFADRGTLFLDEIGEIPLGSQAKLLRAVQSQEVRRVGSPTVRNVDVRVIAATNRDLSELVAKNQFRSDLYYRLNIVEITVPPLSDRQDDVPLLAMHFIEVFAGQYKKNIRGLSRAAQSAIMRYGWPGNIRELENALGSACMVAEGEIIELADLPERVRTRQNRPRLGEPEGLGTLEQIERQHVRKVLAHVDGNKARAAEILGISRATLYRLIGDQPNAAAAGDSKD